ncbi:MAG: hypothetical protein K9I68_02785 [Bacteroidales bacterium]|nr:hypothetical protein [Bacteroidales bacterium]MCF8336365.1 hypothetical protein [Bacteroidales bacterium]
MKNYYCPICRAHLRVGDNIVLAAKSPYNEKGLIFLNPEVGNYSKETHPDFEIREGEEYKFYCPVCHATLNDKEKKNLVKMNMEEEGTHYDFYFSNIAGEEVTYRISEQEVEKYGYHKDRYEKYFDLPDEYKKYL